MNCCPLPLPTFLVPEGSNGGPPFAGAANAPAGVAAASTAGAGAAAAVKDELAPPPNPQPVFPA